jgi:alpha-glucuronidase
MSQMTREQCKMTSLGAMLSMICGSAQLRKTTIYKVPKNKNRSIDQISNLLLQVARAMSSSSFFHPFSSF